MIVADDFEKLQREVAELNRQHSEMQGQFKQMRKIVRKEFGCKKLPEAVALLDKMHAEMIEVSESYVKMKKSYERELRKAKKRLEK